MPLRARGWTGISRRRLLRARGWPLRWRLAAVSASLTLAILMLFGAIVGGVATQRIRDDFNDEVRTAAQILAREFKIDYGAFRTYVQAGPRLNDFVLPDDASARVLDVSGRLLRESPAPPVSARPGPASPTTARCRVATEPVVAPDGSTSGYVQYGRNVEHVDSTVERLWLFIVAGVLGGTLLASFAGVAIAGRAMRPIASLTATAREVATTRDPSRRMPEPTVRRRGRRAGPDPGGDAALSRRRQGGARGGDAEAARVRRRCLARAAHPADQRARQPRAAAGVARFPGQAEDREIVDSALRSSRRMSRLVADLLLLARADAGRLDAHRRCDLAEIAGNAAAEAAPLMGARALTVDNDRPLRVEGSPDELHRMVLNLLDNAARHTPAGARIELTLRAGAGDAVVEVADDGPGIAPKMREQVFDRFVRGAGPADTARRTGTGLGLAIVSAVALSHGGSVEASGVGSGRGAVPRPHPARRILRNPLAAL